MSQQQKTQEIKDSVDDLSSELKFKRQTIKIIENTLLDGIAKLEHEVKQSVESLTNNTNQMLGQLRAQNYYSQEVAVERPQYFLEKTFKYKESILTEFMKFQNYQIIYNMVVAAAICLGANLMFDDYFNKGVFIDFSLITSCFQGFFLIVRPWLIIHLFSYMVVPFTQLIIKLHIKSYFWIPVFLSLQFSIFYTGFGSIKTIDGLGMASITSLLCETMRIVLKTHSYIRNKLLYCTKNKYQKFIPNWALKHGFKESDLNIPDLKMENTLVELKRYTYFLFSPTLVYRNIYIKSPTRNYKKLLNDLLNFLLSIYFMNIMFKTMFQPQILYLNYNLSLQTFIQTLFKFMVPGTMMIFMLFYGLMHCWFNIWSEIMRFPDRQFYLDWWTSPEFGTYYRKWNIVVHEWLYYYVYGDMQRFTQGKLSKSLCYFMTFLISDVIHEAIITCVLGFFYPLLFVTFGGPGLLFIWKGVQNKKSQHYNIIFWIFIFVGTSFLMTMYLAEYYIRQQNLVSSDMIKERWGFLEPGIPRCAYHFAK